MIQIPTPLSKISQARLIAIGGGGFAQGTDPFLEDFVLQHAAGAATRIGYIATASEFDAKAITNFHRSFGPYCVHTTDFKPGCQGAEAKNWLQQLDAVFIGGGNTARMLDKWRSTGLDRLLMDAAANGLLLAGVSAGAMVWFGEGLSDSLGGALRPLPGLNLFNASFCPHFDTEPDRQPAFENAIAQGQMAHGFALDDGAAILLDSRGVSAVCLSRPESGAYFLQRQQESCFRIRLS